ncbi:MAG: DUF721 domain-containing protein [Bacteroidales bacterium]|nr:DUF721 domain-containing protein [Bacteroidales bacterium]
MRRRSKPNIVGELIRLRMKALGKENDYLEAVVKNHWAEIVGRAIDRETENMYFLKNLLYVKIRTPMLKPTLISLKEQYKKLVNEFVNNEFIDGIVFY